MRQIDQLADTYARAFVDDPMIRWPMTPSAGLSECTALFRILLESYLELGVVWQLGDCVATASWLPPAATAKFADIDLAMRSHVKVFTVDDGRRYGQFWDWITSKLPDEPCWFLDMIAVHPDHQGQGMGGELIAHGLDLARADGLPAVLETSQHRNVGYYQRFGFDVVAEEQAPDGGPMIWFMRHS